MATILSKIDFAKNGFKSKEEILANGNKLLNELTVDQYMRLTTEDRINMYTQKMVDDLNNYNLDKYRFEKKSIASKIEDQLLNRQATIRVLEHPRGNIGIDITEYGDDTLVFITDSSQSYDNIAQMTGLKPGSFKTVYVEVLRGKTGQAKTGQPYLAYQDGRSQAIVMDLVNKIIEKENLGVKPPAPIDIPWLDIRQKLFNIKDRSLKVSDAINGAQAKNAQRTQGLKPVSQQNGVFGTIWTKYSGRPKEAIKQLLAKKEGEVPSFVTRQDIGDIDLVYGKGGTDGFGLAHIAEKHPEVIDKLDEILLNGTVRRQSNDRQLIESADHTGVVRLDWNGQEKQWVATAFENKNPASGGLTAVTKTAPTGNINDAVVANTIPTKPKNVNGLSTATTSRKDSTNRSSDRQKL